MRLPILIAMCCLQNVAFAQAKTDKTLQRQLHALADGDQFQQPPQEQFYVVQERPIGLAKRFIVGAGMGTIVNSNIYVSSHENTFGLGYHFTDRFFTKANFAWVHNRLTNSAERLWDESGRYPDTAFVKQRYDGALGFNLIYGKARITSDAIFYFDQYIALGGGMVNQDNGVESSKTPAATADVGVSLWFGRYVGLQLGAKDYYFEERRRLSASRVHQVAGYSNVNMLL